MKIATLCQNEFSILYYSIKVKEREKESRKITIAISVFYKTQNINGNNLKEQLHTRRKGKNGTHLVNEDKILSTEKEIFYLRFLFRPKDNYET